ncbi:MAG TPA: MoaD/ThiS family protein [Nitrospirota bacterium]|nr:MoaD/ThiS family protein [Nitrospirota bacterium]
MRVEIRLLAGARKILPDGGGQGPSLNLEVEEGITCAEALETAGIDAKKTLVVLLNGRHAEPGRRLSEGDIISIFPPVAGG